MGHRASEELLQPLDQLNPWIADLDQALEKEAERRPEVTHLMKQAGVADR